jgi:hypothetical protein
MARMIRSAIPIESEIAARNFSDGGPPFQSDSLHAAKIDAAISETRFRPSSMHARYHIRLLQLSLAQPSFFVAAGLFAVLPASRLSRPDV